VSIDQQEFSYIRELVHNSSGMMLEQGKEYLVEARLRPLAESAGLGSVRDLIERLRTTVPGVAHWRVIEALTTNETSFFRDQQPFDTFRTTIVPALMEARDAERTLNIWSAACSTGQEPYTIAIVIREHFPRLGHSGAGFARAILRPRSSAALATAPTASLKSTAGCRRICSCATFSATS
jgi:chemotaxis protein methyltransferase CheR